MRPGLFIIDGKSTLRQLIVNDLPVGRSVDEVLRLVQAYQFTDEHGEGESAAVCSEAGRQLRRAALRSQPPPLIQEAKTLATVNLINLTML